MFCRNYAALLTTFALFLAVGQVSCARKEPAAPQRLAVLPFDNLTADAHLDWVNNAAMIALSADLAPVKEVGVAQADSLDRAYSLKATRFAHSYFFLQNNQLELRTSIEDAATHKMVRTFVEQGPVSGGILPLVNQLAKQVNPAARPFSTGNSAAFQAFGEALAATDAAAQDRALQASTQADPNFSAAYLVWAEILLRRGDRDGAGKVVAAGLAHQPNAVDRAKLELLAANAKGDVGAQIPALKKLWESSPNDLGVLRQLAELELAQRRFPEAAQDFQALASLDKEDVAVLNSLGYAQAYAGNLEAARRALTEYQTRSPEDANALDSLGEVSFYLGDFAAAEKYFEAAHQKNPRALHGSELLKAAQARLMTGDLPGADAIFRRYADFLKTVPGAFVEYEQAQWEFLTGRRKDAIQRLQASVPRVDANTSAIALCQLSIWKLQMGDQKGALADAQNAAERATSQVARTQSAICRLLATGATVKSGSSTVDSFALLFQKKFDAALPVLEAAYHETNPNTDGQVRILLAWANVELGRIEDARSLLRLYPIPLASGDVLFASLTFPRIFFLRGALLENEGKHDDARRNYQLYLKFAGDLPGIFGDEEKARKSL